MTRNQKIALGCGGAGCAGLIMVVVVGGLIYIVSYRQVRRVSRDYQLNVNLSNSNSNSEANDNSSNSNSNPVSVASMSEDDKHRLFFAATMTGDSELINRVNVKLGLMNEDFTPGEDYERFLGADVAWRVRNMAFIRSINTTEKARAYVNEHFPE